MAKLKITHNNNGTPTDAYVSPTLVGGAHFGGTGGVTTQSGYQIQPTVKVGSNTATTGNILFQKGSHKFRVSDNANPNNIGTCTLVNLPTPTVPNTMSIQVNTASLGGANANAYVSSGASTSAYITYNTANLNAYSSPTVGQFVFGTGATGNVTVTAINATVGSVANITVTYASQTFANLTYLTNTTISTGFMASRITNKYVWDFGSDGSLNDNISGGFNPNRYRYHLSAPTAATTGQFVQVASA